MEAHYLTALPKHVPYRNNINPSKPNKSTTPKSFTQCASTALQLEATVCSKKQNLAFLNRLTRFHAVRKAFGFSSYKYLTVLLFSAV